MLWTIHVFNFKMISCNFFKVIQAMWKLVWGTFGWAVRRHCKQNQTNVSHRFLHLCTSFKHTVHIMGHHSNSLRYSGATKQQSAGRKYQFARCRAALYTSDEISTDADGSMPSGMENIAPLDLTELSQARKRAENYQRRLYGSQRSSNAVRKG